MKLTIYIVDDEPMAIRYLETLLKGTGLEIVIAGKASNGVKAVSEILKLHPDFVFADISMPVMNGLEMSEYVLKQNPSQKIFLLTAYRDFEYAKQSVKIGVTDYILKNELSEAMLEELLHKHMTNLEQEKRERHAVMSANIRNIFLTEEAQSRMDYERIYQNKPLQRYILFYVAGKPGIAFQHGGHRGAGYVDCYAIENSAFGTDISCRAFVEILQNEYCGIFFTQPGIKDVKRECRKIAETMIEYFQENMPWHICLISKPADKFTDLPEVYHRLRSRMEFLYIQEERVILEEELLIRSEADREECQAGQEERFADWKKMLAEGDCTLAEKSLRHYLEDLKAWCNVWEYTDYIWNLYQCLKEQIREKNLNPDLIQMQDEYQDIGLLERELFEAQDNVLRAQEERRQKSYSRHVILAQEFINRNYKEDISVADIAEAAGISEGHLRRCFKKEMDINVVNYLTEYRLSHAKRLMQDRKGSIDEIWKQTGFTSGQYFSYVFKKKEGMSPREYIRQIDDGIHSSEDKEKI